MDTRSTKRRGRYGWMAVLGLALTLLSLAPATASARDWDERFEHGRGYYGYGRGYGGPGFYRPGYGGNYYSRGYGGYAPRFYGPSYGAYRPYPIPYVRPYIAPPIYLRPGFGFGFGRGYRY